MKQFKTKTFKKEQTEWYKKLKDEGFDDIEDKNGNLYQPNPRTKAYKSQDEIRDFFFALDKYLNSGIYISERDRAVLELYTVGTYVTEIVQKLKIPRPTINLILAKHKQKMLELNE